MADNPVGGVPSPFNIPASMVSIQSRDPEFWRILAEWRTREDATELSNSEEDDALEALVAHADDALLPMIDCRVATATAIRAKLEALREVDCHSLVREISEGFTFFDAILRDIEHLAYLEISENNRDRLV